MSANGSGISFWGDENAPKFIVVIVLQLCEYTKKHGIVHFSFKVSHKVLNASSISKS